MCDEPIASLDLARQRDICGLIDRARIETECGVLLITHDINPVLQMVDRVVYLANGQVSDGTVEDVFTAECLSVMYQTPIEVLRTRGRIVVVGAFGDEPASDTGHDNDHEQDRTQLNGSVRPGLQRAR